MSTKLNASGVVFPDTTVQTTALPAPGVANNVLTSDGTNWVSAQTGVVTEANNLSNGSAYEIPYQLSSGLTTFLPTGVAGQVLLSAGSSAAPAWGGVNGGTF